jgi:hypothetical protein
MKGNTEASDETAYISTHVPKTGQQNSPQEDAKFKGNQPIRMKKRVQHDLQQKVEKYLRGQEKKVTSTSLQGKKL